MRTLAWLVRHHLRNLTGAQFKMAAYLYRRLQRNAELTIRTKDLAEATGLSVGSAQAASNGLAKQSILLVEGGPGKTKTYRLPAAKPRKSKPVGSKTAAVARRQADKPASSPAAHAVKASIPVTTAPESRESRPPATSKRKASKTKRVVPGRSRSTVMDLFDE
jgi:hypothetical protein